MRDRTLVGLMEEGAGLLDGGMFPFSVDVGSRSLATESVSVEDHIMVGEF
jgi:hypothetical protein